MSNVFPRMLPIYLQWQGANVFVAIKAGTGKALRDALGGTRGGRTGAELTFVLCRVSRHHGREDIFYILIFSSI